VAAVRFIGVPSYLMMRQPTIVFADPPVLCGHRGSGRGPGENTLESFRAAVEAGLPWVEVDARFTADDVLFARHDPVTDDGRFVSELTAAEARAAGLMPLADLLEWLPPEIGVDVDVKTSLEDALRPRERTTAALVAELLAEERGRRPLLVSSFDPSALIIFRERVPDVPIGLLTWLRFPLRKAIPAAVHLGAEVVAPHFASFPLGEVAQPAVERDVAHSVRVAHQAGLQVVAWCPKPAAADLLAAAGVDCLIVDEAGSLARRVG
jgi:glycerophosphoryl diester phosphodiesterase